MSEEQNSIPKHKMARAARYLGAGAKVGSNYLKYYGSRLGKHRMSRDQLDEANAQDIYQVLSQLKGGPLKMAQMLSLDQNMLPKAFANQFSQAQHSAPPLSYPLVVKTFQQELGRKPHELFDSFSHKAVHAASIGQVHRAEYGGKSLAVKVQYPGIADSLLSDLRVVRPLAMQLFGLSNQDVDRYFKEVERMLLEETDYALELKRSKAISEACAPLEGLEFPHYYEEFSGKRILTMDWIEGLHLDEFARSGASQELRDHIGQLLWNFYDYQLHHLLQVHADPHPGNFLIRGERLGVIDFGCVKEIPQAFHDEYFRLLDPKLLDEPERFVQILEELQLIYPDDSPSERQLYIDLFQESLELLGRPFRHERFDFGDAEYMEAIYHFGEEASKMKELRQSRQARGPEDALYINRTYFGLYHLLHMLGAKINTRSAALSPEVAGPQAQG